MEVVPVAISLMRTALALGAGLWFWVSAAVEFGVVFGVWLAFCMRFWLALFDWSMLLPMLLPNCSLLMWRTTAVALKACWYVERRGFMVKRKQKYSKLHKLDLVSKFDFTCIKLQALFTMSILLTLHLLFAKFLRICRLTDSWMFLQSAVSPAILKSKTTKSKLCTLVLLFTSSSLLIAPLLFRSTLKCVNSLWFLILLLCSPVFG